MLDKLLIEDARSEAFLRNVVEMVRARVNQQYAVVDVVRMQDHLFAHAIVGPYSYRFGIPPEEEVWVCEVRNEIVDPPGYWGTEATLEATVDQKDVADWIAAIIAPEVHDAEA